MRRPGRWVGSVALSALLLGLAACGGGEDKDQAAAEDALAEELNGGLDNEAVLAEPQIVIEGLTEIKTFLNEIKSNLGSDGALEANDAMVPIWDDIEGTVKSTDAAAHAQFEVQWAALDSAALAKEKDKSRVVADELLKLADAYLAAHPVGATSSPTPSASTSPSSTAIPSSTPTSSSTATSTPAANGSVDLGPLDTRGMTVSTATP